LFRRALLPSSKLSSRSLALLPTPPPPYIWKEGALIPWESAQLHILSHAVQFGASLFEGIRCYDTPRGPAIVHLEGHLRRLLDSCKIYRVECPYTVQDLSRACFEVVHGCGLRDCYIRPTVLRGYGAIGMDGVGSPVETFVPAFPFPPYLGGDAFEHGIDVCTSSWARAAPNTFPGMAKMAGHYTNASLIKMEAQANGYAEAIALSPDGLVSEGSGQNLFLVRDGEIVTPPINGSNLNGLTRACAIQLAQDAGLRVRVEPISREALYVADELFYTGTATEVMPIRSLDKIDIGSGTRGPVTAAVQERYQAIVNGREEDVHGWLSVAPP